MATLAFDIGIVNLAVCVSDNGLVRYCNVLSIGSPKDPLCSLITQLLEALRDRVELIGNVRHIRIEQQLGRAATKNFALSAALFTYTSDHYPHADVAFVSPRKKFKILASMKNIPGISERAFEFKTTRGAALKKLAVEAAIALAQHRQDHYFLEQISQLRKKDDMADAYGLAVLC